MLHMQDYKLRMNYHINAATLVNSPAAGGQKVEVEYRYVQTFIAVS